MPPKYLMLWLSFVVVLAQSCRKAPDPQPTDNNLPEFIRAADLSYLPRLQPFEFRDSSNRSLPLSDICRNYGVNVVRLRLWHSPAERVSDFATIKTLCSELRAKGFKIWLTVHYSDTWADPSQQQTPAAWQGLGYEVLRDSVRLYTRRIVREMQPDYIQIGNEINNGLLLPQGARSDTTQFKGLLREAAQAVRAESAHTRIMIHYAGISGAIQFFAGMSGMDYDMIGISYYPIWHGTNLTTLGNLLGILHANTGREVMVAETAYPFTLGWNDWTNNVLGQSNQLIPQFPASPQGQLAFMRALRAEVERVGAKGFCYWGGEWIAFDGATSANGSSWENQALFDFDNKALPAFAAFAE